MVSYPGFRFCFAQAISSENIEDRRFLRLARNIFNGRLVISQVADPVMRICQWVGDIISAPHMQRDRIMRCDLIQKGLILCRWRREDI